MSRNTCIYTVAALIVLYLGFQSCQGEQSIRMAQYTVNGQRLYVANCQNCHGTKGEGLGNLYPPLTDSIFLGQHRDKLPCMIKNGLSGPISVHGKSFDTEMPPNPHLAPIEIAYLLTYIGNSFGNQMGIYTLEDVQEALARCAD